MISIKNLTAGYGASHILQNFSLELEQGEIYALIGPSGCGKSTLLKVLCGILPPQSGTIEYNGKAASAANRIPIGYVPQNYGLLAWKTVRENIFLPFYLSGGKKGGTPQGAAEIIDELGLEPLLSRYPAALSGGQKQRVALARAFISNPGLLLMDEPFSALDAFTSEASQALFMQLWAQRRVTTLLITHSMFEAAALGTRILLMNPHSRQIGEALHNDSAGKDGNGADKLAMAALLKERFREMLP